MYGSPLINVCSGSYCKESIKFDDDPNSEYMVVFQCRVRPESVRICSGDLTYWVIRDPEDIRPYGLLITKKSTMAEQKHRDKQAEFQKSYEKFVSEKVDVSAID